MSWQMTVNGITSVWRGGLKVGGSISIMTRLRSREMDFLWEKKSLVRFILTMTFTCRIAEVIRKLYICDP